MHNIISRNQLAEWMHIECTLNRCNEELDLVNDYFDRNLELLVDSLKAEVYSDVDAYVKESPKTILQDYDEIFEDDDGYPD